MTQSCPYQPWSQKMDEFVWRGSDSNHLRFEFNLEADRIRNASSEPEFWNVGISHMIRQKCRG